jgi:acyl carrier protein
VTREQILTAIRAHLAEELEVDPASISEATRFREDLEADSLDLYTLVQELEDSYGVKISDEQATRILTVGQAVEFVLASDLGEAAGELGPAAHDAVPIANSTPSSPSAGDD